MMRDGYCLKPGCFHVREPGAVFCHKHAPMVAYRVTIELVAGPRVSAAARRQEPRELFLKAVESFTVDGWELVGDVSVTPIRWLP